MSQTILSLLIEASLQTFYMVFAASLLAIVGGVPLGVILYGTRKGSFFANKAAYFVLVAVINVARSIPFIILMIAVTPLTRFIVGSSIGTQAAIVPLSLGAIPFVARVVDNALSHASPGLVEAGYAMGATTWQIITKFLLPESLPSIIHGLTLTVISLVGYSAMAGVIGGGGLGDLAIRYGYQRFNLSIMFITITIMVFVVQGLQFWGDRIARKIAPYR